MSALVQRIQEVRSIIDRARAEETPDGNPLVAARNYITAMELITEMCNDVGSEPDDDKKRFFLYQVRQRMAVYEERVQLLLTVAADMGLEDTAEAVRKREPGFVSGVVAAQGADVGGTGAGACGCDAAVAPSDVAFTSAPTGSVTCHPSEVPTMEHFFERPPASSPQQETVPVETILEQFSFPGVRKE